METKKVYSKLGCLLIVLCLGLNGCINLGPKVLPHNRKDFNTALQLSDKEQLLLNLVRMQFADQPYFLGVSSISAQMRFYTELHAAGVFTNAPYSVPIVGYSENPTIVYVPLQGEAFTREIMAPMTLDKIYLLLQSGWSLARVLRVTTQSIGHVSNAPLAARPSTKHLPHYKRFVELVHLMKKLQLDGSIELVGKRIDKSLCLDIRTKKNALNAKQINRMYQLLNLKSNGDTIRITQGKRTNSNMNELVIVTRSTLGMMYYLSKSVEVSQDELISGAVEFPINPDGSFFDWTQVTKGMMRIHVSTKAPCCATVSVYYRHKWYFIADNDMNSKETFSMINLIFSLEAGDVKGQTGPVLTLPV